MTHVVLDLETFGVAPDSAIVSIGAVALESGREFYAVIRDPSGSVDAGSIRWWLQQRDEVRLAVWGAVGYESEKSALLSFAKWLDSVRDNAGLRLWGSEDFDSVILGATYARNGMERPWHYQETRGLRTAFERAGLDEEAFEWGDGIEHIAIDCARHAAAALRLALAPEVEGEGHDTNAGVHRTAHANGLACSACGMAAGDRACPCGCAPVVEGRDD